MARPGIVPKNHPHQQIARDRAEQQLTLVAGEIADEAGAPVPSPYPAGKRGVDDNVDDRETPPCVFVPLNAEFDFTLDAASSAINRKCDRYCTLDGFFLGSTKMGPQHGLVKQWEFERVWVNPPFSRLRQWVEKAWDDKAELVCMLLPNNRQEQPYWQDLIEPYRDKPGSILTTRFIRKRRPFLHMGEGIGNRTSKNPPFGLVNAIWDRRSPRAKHR